MYIFDGKFSEAEKKKLRELISLHEQEINEDGGCSFTGVVEAYVEKKENDFYISNKNILVR